MKNIYPYEIWREKFRYYLFFSLSRENFVILYLYVDFQAWIPAIRTNHTVTGI